MRRILLILAVLLPLISLAQEKRTYTFVERDSALRLDVWSPEVPRGDRACVVAVFGGGFVSGRRDDQLQQSIARQLTARGYTVVSPDYRLGLLDTVHNKQYKGISGITNMFQHTIDMAAEDCAAAVAYVVQHAGTLNINPERIVLTGCSAGAIAVLQLDYCRANGLAAAAELPQGWMPAAVVPYAGAVMCKGKPSYQSAPAPTMLMHGAKDKIVSYKKFPRLLKHALYGADKVFDAFVKGGYPCWIVRCEGVGHEVASFLPNSVDLFCGFVEQVFSGRRTTVDATFRDEKLLPTEWTTMTVIDLYAK